MRHFRKSSVSRDEYYDDHHRFEHWYRDNSVYFISARCRDGFAAFESEAAKIIFWDRFEHYARTFGFIAWVTTLLRNHYHTIGYLPVGENLGKMMQRIHGSVAKLVNDLLPERRERFWHDSGQQTYFDGCIRNEIQASRGSRYTLMQAVRCGLVRHWQDYPHTRLYVDLEVEIRRAREMGAYMDDVVYARYARERRGRGRGRYES